MKRALAFAGLLGGGLWILIGLVPPDWGPPGTSAYAGYEFWNRLWTPALVLMLCGFVSFYLTLRASLTRWARGGLLAALLGWGLMALGNFAEFWIFTTESYTSVWRNGSWMTFLLGTLIMLIATSVTGLALARTHLIPKWLAVLLALMLPLVIGVGAVNLGWVGWPTGGLTALLSGYLIGRKDEIIALSQELSP